MFAIARISFISLVLGLACGVDIYSQVVPIRDPDSSNILSITKTDPDRALKIEPVTGFDRSSLVRNPAKTREAFILCIPATKGSELCDMLVFVKDLAAKTTYVITGEPDLMERNRPIDNLKWLSNDVLSYERWAQPHFGHRYAVNMKLRKQTAAYFLKG